MKFPVFSQLAGNFRAHPEMSSLVTPSSTGESITPPLSGLIDNQPVRAEQVLLVVRQVMAVMNNLVLFEQHVKQNSLSDIVPDLATDWAWDEDGTKLVFHLRQGVKWHDGKPFTAADVKCTWDLIQGKSAERLRVNPRKAWYTNLAEVVPNGDYEVAFVLKRPQPAFLALLATGMSPVYPCHLSPAQMRQHPIGTGPSAPSSAAPPADIRR
jgi:ABC-type transport system substrate-binding protein